MRKSPRIDIEKTIIVDRPAAEVDMQLSATQLRVKL